MSMFLLFGFVLLPFILVTGDDISCYINAETSKAVIKTTHENCSDLCTKVHGKLADGTSFTFRGCGSFRWHPGMIAEFDRLNLSSQQKEALLITGPDSMHFCNKNLCNGGDSVIRTAALRIVLVAVIIAVINCN